jgi:uncharacterized protein (TIRG00374 family)
MIVNIAGAALGFGLLGVTVYRNWGQVKKVFGGHIDARLFAVAFAVYLVALSLTFLRWFVLVRVIDPRFTLRASYLLGFIGNLFNLVIPGAVGGDLVKATYLVQMDIKRTQAVASMVIDRILGLLGLFLLAGLAGLFAWPMASHNVRILIAVVWAAVTAGLLVLAAIFSQSLTRFFPKLLEGHSRRAGILRELKVMSETYRRGLAIVGAALIGSSLLHSLYVVAFYLVCLAIFDEPVPGFAQHLLIVPLTLFTTAVPVPFGAIGVSEGVGDELGRMIGHPGAGIGMMGFRVLMYGSGIISALVYLANMGLVRSLTEGAEELEEKIEEGTLDE